MRRFSGWIVAAVIIVLILFLGIGTYNSLVSYEQKTDQYYSQIQNQLQRRSDLIPNLVSTVKGYAAHEKEVLGNIADARARLAGASDLKTQAAADQQLSSALSRLLVVVENYPNLKADANFRQLMDELAGTENRISVARKDYNEAVRVYNVKVKRFPGVIFANLFGFNEKPYFEAAPNAQNVPEVNF